ncbi:MAG: glutamate-5-semialdehyde dehydrogenase [Oscillospiraceae bacterium]|nr:glutamate-5-semialdehyde dehydrogenase [Oscillospiraceae bacterium]
MILEICKRAKEASYKLAYMSTDKKNLALRKIADNIIKNEVNIISKNEIDIKNGKENKLTNALIDRLTLNKSRIEAMADGLRQIAELPDPIGEITGGFRRPNGLEIGMRRVPIGVIAVIYESRPNVTADVAGLTLKSGNCVILKGGKEAINSNLAIAEAITEALDEAHVSRDCVQIVSDTNRESTIELLKMDKYIDLLIPRGGEGLKKIILEHSSIPVIMATAGNNHVYVDEFADLDMAEKITINAKTQRPGVCNAIENLLVDERQATEFVPRIAGILHDLGVEIRGCEKTCKLVPFAKKATEKDYETEFLDMIIAVKITKGFDEAVDHINKYGTHHSEAIVTENYEHARAFLERIDAAAVYVNASTRFTDGFEFGFGAEIGISNQKLHARGPIGLLQLTSQKYIIYGNGQVRK